MNYFFIELVAVLVILLASTRLRGMSLGMMGGLGLLALCFGCGVQPQSPPFKVILVIITVVVAASTVETAGGLAYLIQVTSRLIKHHPQHITLISPLITYLLTLVTGTSHIIYPLLPIIAATANRAGIRPEKPLVASVLASQQAILASPISAAVAVLITQTGLNLMDILLVLLPATLIGTLSAAFWTHKMGNGYHHPVRFRRPIPSHTSTDSEDGLAEASSARGALALFLGALILIVVLGSRQELRPSWRLPDGSMYHLPMYYVVAISMLAVAGLISVIYQLPAKRVAQGKIFNTGMQAVVTILGVAWLGNSWLQHRITAITNFTQAGHTIWQIGMVFFLTTIVTTSQAVTLQLLLPVALQSIGDPLMVLGILPAINSFYVLPNYPTLWAAVEADKTGTTRIGKFIFNHSFIKPGLLSTFIACLVSYSLVRALGLV